MRIISPGDSLLGPIIARIARLDKEKQAFFFQKITCSLFVGA
jgi:hypothetical protein